MIKESENKEQIGNDHMQSETINESICLME